MPAIPAAQTPPTPTSGQITVGEEAHTSIDAVINAEECNGSGVVHLSWQIPGTFPIGGVTYKLFAANQATTGACPTQSNASTSLVAAEVLPELTSTRNPVTDETYATSAIATAAGFGACDATAPQSIFLCVEGIDPNNVSTAVGTARGTLTLDRRPAVATTGGSVSSGDSAVNVSWNLVPSTADPPADYYLIDAQPISSTITAFDPTPIHTSARVTASPYRLGGLVNGVVYSVRVWTFSPADNPSDPFSVGTAEALPSADFWETYKADGGREQGGCSSGPAGLLAVGGAAALLAMLRRRR